MGKLKICTEDFFLVHCMLVVPLILRKKVSAVFIGDNEEDDHKNDVSEVTTIEKGNIRRRTDCRSLEKDAQSNKQCREQGWWR